MNLIEASIEGMRQLAENDSAGEGIDEHWEAVLPETYDIMANEIFLAMHGRFINESMMRQAYEFARNLPLRDVSDRNDAELFLHCLVRGTWLGIADDPEFQAHVNNNVKGVIHAAQGAVLNPQRISWTRFSRLLLPYSEEEIVQIVGALVERFRQHLFAEHCWRKLTHGHVGKEVNKHMYALLTDSEVITQNHREEAYRRLSEISSNVTAGLDGIDPSDAMHDWVAKLSGLPPHTQLQKIGATPTAIYQNAIDKLRKGGKYEHVPFEEKEEFGDTFPDESLEAAGNESIGEEFIQLLSINQHKIEEILSYGSPKKRRAKIGKRRFKVMQMLADDPDLTSVEIAERLMANEQTIGRDREKIKKSRALILEAVYS